MLTSFAAVTGIALLATGCGDDISNPGRVDASVAVDAASSVDGSVETDAAPSTPSITAVDYPVIALGGRLVISGANLDGTTEVTVGGVAHANLVDVAADSVTIEAISDQVVVGAQDVVTTSPAGSSNAFGVTAIRLLISEIDPDTPGADAAEFIELDTGLAQAVSLDGYVIALFNGNSATGTTLDAIDLNADTAATGLHLIGPATLALAPQVVFDGPIQAGEDAAAVYQFAGDVGTFPATFGDAGEAGLLDAVIWESGDDDDSAAIAPLVVDNVVINEGNMTAMREVNSIARCPGMTTPRTGAQYVVVPPTPGALNAACP